jgi:hypothetical protein
LQSTTSETLAYFLPYPIPDMAVEAHLQMNGGAAQLYLRLHDGGSAYIVRVDSIGQVLLYRNDAILAAAVIPAITPETWVTLGASVIGDTLRVSINGVEVLVVQDVAPLPAGAVAFSGSGANGLPLLLDDFNFWTPAADSLGKTGESLNDQSLVVQLNNEVSASDVTDLITAINNANADCGTPTTIHLTASVYTLTSVDNSSARGANGLPIIVCDITIIGDIPAIIERSPTAPRFRLFEIASIGSLTLENVTVQNGWASVALWGGGLLNNGGSLTIRSSSILNNQADATQAGGGIFAFLGQLSVEDSQISNNLSRYGGGLSVADGTVTLSNSRIENNRAWFGGGIRFVTSDSTSLTILNTLISGNISDNSGAGLDLVDGSITIQSSVISGNNSGFLGGGIHFSPGLYSNPDSLFITGSILANNHNNEENGDALGVFGSSVANVTINNSCITGNGHISIFKDPNSLVTVNATGNWWGAPQPSVIGGVPSSGDSVSVDVNYSNPQPSPLSPPTVPAACDTNPLTPTFVPDYNPAVDCRATIASPTAAVYTKAQIAQLTNPPFPTELTPLDTLSEGTYVVITALHPNRRYAQVRYGIINGATGNIELSAAGADRWIRIRNKAAAAFSLIAMAPKEGDTNCVETQNPTKFKRLRIDELVARTTDSSLPLCQEGWIVNCRPTTGVCASIFGCTTNQTPGENPNFPLTLSEFGSLDDGCSNTNPKCNTPCPAWPDNQPGHCGHDLVVKDDAENGFIEDRGVYTLIGGIFREFSPGNTGQNTYKIRVRVSGEQIREYQYTHVAENPILGTDQQYYAEYVAAGTLLGNYVFTTQTGPVADHVHALIKTFNISDYPADYDTEDIAKPNNNKPRRNDRYEAPGIVLQFYVPFKPHPGSHANSVGNVLQCEGSGVFQASAVQRYHVVNGTRTAVTYTYSDNGTLPGGLSINPQTGVICGTINAVPGTYTVEISATDNRHDLDPAVDSRSGLVRFSWTINNP